MDTQKEGKREGGCQSAVLSHHKRTPLPSMDGGQEIRRVPLSILQTALGAETQRCQKPQLSPDPVHSWGGGSPPWVRQGSQGRPGREQSPSASTLGRGFTGSPRTTDPAGASGRPFISKAEWHSFHQNRVSAVQGPLRLWVLDPSRALGREDLAAGQAFPPTPHCSASAAPAPGRRDWGATIFLPITREPHSGPGWRRPSVPGTCAR